MMASRDWFQTSPHGTAKQRFARIARHLDRDRLTLTVSNQHASAMGEQSGEQPAEQPSDVVDDLAGFFRNIAVAAHAHDLGDESLYLAEELTALQWSLGSRQRHALALLILASMISVRHGSSRLPLSRDQNSYLGTLLSSLLAAGKLDLDAKTLLSDIDELVRSVTLDHIIGRENEYRPLIVSDDCVYQHRMLWCESRLADRLRARIAGRVGVESIAAHGEFIEQALADVLERAPEKHGVSIQLSDEQIAAVRCALTRRFTVISGGPGTGKTAIVVTMLRVLARLGESIDTIALAAPTGKAANRMWSSIRSSLEAVSTRSDRDDVLLTAEISPRTIHRLLGYVPGIDKFRHHENNPLSATTVIVDEASMIDLSLMERLLRAVPDTARLILLGDADQLPSVDAGAVLRDLVLAGTHTDAASFSVRLTHSYRMDARDPKGYAILRAAQAVNIGNVDTQHADDSESVDGIPIRTALKQLEYAGIEHLETDGKLSLVHEFIDSWYRKRIKSQDAFAFGNKTFRHYGGRFIDSDEAELTALFKVYDNSRLLTVTRRQNTGSEAMNRRLHRRILAEAQVDKSPGFYPGEPIIMRRNDYERGLFNGDQGLIVRVAVDGAPQHFHAVFPRGTGSFALFRLDAIRAHIELAFAMTVHKSQGSEFGEIALILPNEELPLLTREMMYTGITRARSAVVLVGPESLLRVAVSRQSQRFSGLANRLSADVLPLPDKE